MNWLNVAEKPKKNLRTAPNILMTSIVSTVVHLLTIKKIPAPRIVVVVVVVGFIHCHLKQGNFYVDYSIE